MKPSTIFIIVCLVLGGFFGFGNTNRVVATTTYNNSVTGITETNQSATDLATLTSDIVKLKRNLPKQQDEGYWWYDVYQTASSVVYVYTLDEDIWDMSNMGSPAMQRQMKQMIKTMPGTRVVFPQLIKCKKNFQVKYQGTQGTKITITLTWQEMR